MKGTRTRWPTAGVWRSRWTRTAVVRMSISTCANSVHENRKWPGELTVTFAVWQSERLDRPPTAALRRSSELGDGITGLTCLSVLDLYEVTVFYFSKRPPITEMKISSPKPATSFPHLLNL